jgi:hypothetical protein
VVAALALPAATCAVPGAASAAIATAASPTGRGAAPAAVPTLNPAGSLTFSWRGDPSRGCQAAGVCDVSGTLEVIPESQFGSAESPRQSDIAIQDADAVARVSDPGLTAAGPRICTDLVPVALSLGVAHGGGAGGHAVVNFAEQPPSSGRCAGPTASELGAISLPARRLPGPLEAYDLSGQVTLHSGPYLVTVASSLRARRPASAPGGGLSLGAPPSPPAPRPSERLLEQITVDYRLQRISGTLTTDFRGITDPACLALDACGTSGSLSDAISETGGSVQVQAARFVGRRVSGAAALRDLRAGRLRIEFVAASRAIRGRLSATATWSGGPTCRDQIAQELGLNGSVKGTAVDLSLAAVNPGGADILRTHCAGPASVDVLGSGGTIAGATFQVRTLGDRRLHLTLPGSGRFIGPGYEGARGGAVAVDLRLLRVRGGTRAVKGLPGIP